MSQDNVEIVREGFLATGSGDPAAAQAVRERSFDAEPRCPTAPPYFIARERPDIGLDISEGGSGPEYTLT